MLDLLLQVAGNRRLHLNYSLSRRAEWDWGELLVVSVKINLERIEYSFYLGVLQLLSMGAFFWDYSGYSYSGLGITEYTEFQFRKERQFWKRNTHGGGDLRTTMSAHARAAASDFPPKISQKNAYSVYSE